MIKKVLLHKSWLELLISEFSKDYMQNIKAFLKDCSQRGLQICPHPKLIFNALNSTPYDKVKVVIIGQDPYHGLNQANGLAFSVDDGIKIPPSLQNIFKELKNDIGTQFPTHGNLQHWADQGVLLLNSTLTVEQHKPNSHKDIGWEIFTDKIIQILGNSSNQVFILWGSYARAKMHLIDGKKNLVLTAPHPSPLSAHKGFFGCKHFSKTNQYLIDNMIEPINWDLT